MEVYIQTDFHCSNINNMKLLRLIFSTMLKEAIDNYNIDKHIGGLRSSRVSQHIFL